MSCPNKASCEMFPQLTLNSALKVWQTFYCDGKYEECVRYVRSLEGRPVPVTLLPNGKNMEAVLTDTGGNTAPPSGRRSPADIRTTPRARGAAAAHPKPAAGTPPASALKAEGPDRIVASYYLRFPIQPGPETADHIKQVLAGFDVAIDALIRKPVPGEDRECLIIITGQAVEMNVYRAILEAEKSAGVIGRVKCIMLERAEEEIRVRPANPAGTPPPRSPA